MSTAAETRHAMITLSGDPPFLWTLHPRDRHHLLLHWGGEPDCPRCFGIWMQARKEHEVAGRIFKFELGDQVSDTITGFEGVITARTQFMNLCVRYGVQPRELHEGKVIEAHWIDEEQLKPTGLVNIAPKAKKSGGPKPAPKAFGY